MRLFRANREDLRTAALADVEKHHLQHPELPATLWEVIQHDLKVKRVSDTSLWAIRLHGRLEESEVIEQQATLLSASDVRVVLLAVENLGAKKSADALPLLLGLTETRTYRTNYSVRHAVMCAVAKIPDRAAIDFLVLTLVKTDGQLRYETSRQLARLTGQDFGGIAKDWEAWWKANGDDFRFETTAAGTPAVASVPAATQPVRWEHELPTVFGTPIYAKRVVLIIDQSGSMKSTVDGVSRMENAQSEFEAAIRMLPQDAYFDVIAYNIDITPWQGKLVQATPQMKGDAIRFIYSLLPGKKTACYDVLASAIDRPETIEAFVFLSDGHPTAGAVVDRATIVQQITQRNAFRRSAIDTIGIDARDESERFMQQLADDNFGSYRSIR